ncbi:hypothetical protein BJ138DRAFT_1119863 [Hygrophoropsis aurantiaca]|uniref:Uncharacterized protein n=1 Tax=Hygrophoropsis aurantiaca TaxID=72124 RepID=A0ACB7ZSB1_9AGAM|nr:hypothetical protein BJ138DRAFT_1119863 [Hygrophoropsis aurantiaca]
MVAFATDPGQSPTDPMQVDGVKSSRLESEENSERLPTNPFPQANMEKPFVTQANQYLLHILLRLRLNARLPTLLQFGNEACYLFTDLGAHIIGPSTLAHESSLAMDLGQFIPDA